MFDEVMTIMNVAEQAALYAKQANDNDLIEKATEIRVRAQRKAGEMLRQAAEQGQRAGKSDGGKMAAAVRWNSSSSGTTSHAPTLAEIGITKDQSANYQRLAAMPDDHFETAVATAKATAGEVTTAFMLREAQKVKPPKGRPLEGKKADNLREKLKAVQHDSELTTCARRLLSLLREQKSMTGPEAQILAEVADAIAAVAA